MARDDPAHFGEHQKSGSVINEMERGRETDDQQEDQGEEVEGKIFW